MFPLPSMFCFRKESPPSLTCIKYSTMCGRFAQTTPPEDLVRIFDLASTLHSNTRFNIAPTQPIVTIRGHANGRHAHICRWGFVPSWAKDLKIGNKMINARSETIFEKRSFAHAAQHQRCVVPASGFYEWRETPAGKMPTLFTPTSGPIFRFAGLWSSWTDPQGELIYTATILTTQANSVMAPFHHRMPIFLDDEATHKWLDPRNTDPEQLKPILKTPEEDSTRLRAVSKRVNNVRNDDPKCWDNATSPQ